MPFNVPGILVPFHLIYRPSLLIPSLVINDLRKLDLPALHKAGYRGAVFDKDNCLTLPHEDNLVPELKEVWHECRSVFGPENILVVSNTAGTRWDSGGIKAESLSHKLGVKVLFHNTLKPGYSCINDIRTYFSSLPRPVTDRELIVVGDRIFTDVVLGNRMRFSAKKTEKDITDSRPEGPLSVFIDKVWKKDAVVLRALEKGLLRLTERYALSEAEKAVLQQRNKSFVRYTTE